VDVEKWTIRTVVGYTSFELSLPASTTNNKQRIKKMNRRGRNRAKGKRNYLYNCASVERRKNEWRHHSLPVAVETPPMVSTLNKAK